MKSNQEYWAERALQREQESYVRGSKRTLKILQEYKKAAGAIRREVNDFYMRYAGKYDMSYEQAVRLLNRPESQEWRGRLGDYVAKIAKEPDSQKKIRLTAELDALSYNSRITRLDALEGQINLIMNDLYDQAVDELHKEFGIEVTESYYTKLFDIQDRYGFVTEIAKITPSMVEEIVSYPWSGAMFSDRLWRNKKMLVFHIRETIIQGIIQGKSISVMSRELSKRMGQSYKNAERLIRTETNHFHGEASLQAYKAAGVEEYEFRATHDERTCLDCGPLDRVAFKVKEAQKGVNFNPMHPNCRCTTVEHDPNYERYFIESGLEVPTKKTWSQWREENELD